MHVNIWHVYDTNIGIISLPISHKQIKSDLYIMKFKDNFAYKANTCYSQIKLSLYTSNLVLLIFMQL